MFRWGPPTHPHSEERLETALAVVRGIPQAVQAREAEVASAADADAHGVDYSADDQAPGASVAKAAAAAPPLKHAAAPAKAPLPVAAAAASPPPKHAAAPANASPPAAAAASEAAPPPKHAAAPANASPPVAAAAASPRLLLPLLHTWLLRPLQL